MKHHKHELGAVSLFIVVFTALLITVVTVSFIRLMIRDQQQATTVDLSQSAYDSAQAGVEDAKRAIIRYQTICANGDAATCLAAKTQINSAECNAGLSSIVTTTDGEVKIQQNIGDNALDQAYTCVKIDLETDDYLGVLEANSSKLIPLTSAQSFNRVLLEWYSSEDLQTANSFEVDLEPGSSLSQPLLSQSLWRPNRPSLMRTQLLQFSAVGGFTLADFDNKSASGQSNVNTLFLYPSGSTGAVSNIVEQASFTGRDDRKTPTGEPLPVTCSGDLTNGGYACRVELLLPDPINAGSRVAYLNVTALYNKANYRITLSNNGTDIALFDGVQPEVDSTGRANDLFRRVQSRVELTDLVDSNFAYPDTAVDITGNFCKDFLITDAATDYSSSCTP